MKTKISLSLLIKALIAVVLFSGCKKEINDELVGDDCSVINSTSNGITTNYTYDLDGRVTLIKSDNWQSTAFVYDTNKITSTYLNGHLSFVKEVILVSGRVVSSSSTSTDASGSFPYGYIRNYTYNSDGYLIQTKTYLKNGNLSSIQDLTYANGNLIKAVTVDARMGISWEANYFYSNNLAKNIFEIADRFYFETDGFPSAHYGKPSKNIVTDVTLKPLSSVVDVAHTGTKYFTYQYDSSGKLTDVDAPKEGVYYEYLISGIDINISSSIHTGLKYSCK